MHPVSRVLHARHRLPSRVVVPEFAATYDVEDVLAVADQCRYLIMATDDDRWSRGADDIRKNLDAREASHVTVEVRSGQHDFPATARESAYAFLAKMLTES